MQYSSIMHFAARLNRKASFSPERNNYARHATR